MHWLIFCLWLFHAATAELRSYNRDHLPIQLKIYSLAFYRKACWPLLQIKVLSFMAQVTFQLFDSRNHHLSHLIVRTPDEESFHILLFHQLSYFQPMNKFCQVHGQIMSWIQSFLSLTITTWETEYTDDGQTTHKNRTLTCNLKQPAQELAPSFFLFILPCLYILAPLFF